MAWEKKRFTVLASCKATVRDPDRIFTGWPRNIFNVHANQPYQYVAVVDTPRGERWALMGMKRQPRVGESIELPVSAHTGCPLGYGNRESLEAAAKITNYRASARTA